MIFDGKKFAEEIIQSLPVMHKKLVVVVDPNNLAGMKYVEMKKKVAQRLGVEFTIYNSQFTNNFQIEDLNKDSLVDGIMIQLPYPNSEELIKQIDPKKDVDGLRDDSPYKPAVVEAVLEILKKRLANSVERIVVVGSRGFVGKRLISELKCLGMDIDDFDLEKLKNADVIISATGKAGLIKPDMVKKGVIAIDVGFPKGDFDPAVAEKASFFTPVPGGVGPVTVAMLFRNLLEN